MKLSVENITFSVGKRKKRLILDDVSFGVQEGEFLSLLGASGAGKSTLLKVIAGITVQDSGSVIFDGEAVDNLAPHHRQIGFVFQDMRLFPNMDVEENIAFPCKMSGMPRKERLERAHHLLECVQMSGFGKRQIASLSGGQQQRVALVRALAAQPHIMLLDEPFSGLDEDLRDDMRSLLLRLHRDFGTTTIMVTHDAIEALEMSDRVVYISKGRVLQAGTPEELYSQPQTREIAACFGDCSTIRGTVQSGVFRADGLELAAATVADGPADAVIRFQGVSLREYKSSEHNMQKIGLNIQNTADEQPSASATPLQIRCAVYRGDMRLARIDIGGQTLTVPTSTTPVPGTKVDVNVEPGSLFMYPASDNKPQENEPQEA